MLNDKTDTTGDSSPHSAYLFEDFTYFQFSEFVYQNNPLWVYKNAHGWCTKDSG